MLTFTIEAGSITPYGIGTSACCVGLKDYPCEQCLCNDAMRSKTHYANYSVGFDSRGPIRLEPFLEKRHV